DVILKSTGGAVQINSALATSGGDIDINAGTNLITQGLSASSTANSGNITLTSATAAAGNLQVTGSIDANGGGASGNGGAILITYKGLALTIGGVTPDNFVSGSINANGAGTGNPGSVTIANANLIGNLQIDLQSSISAVNGSNLGLLTLNGAGTQ